MKFMLDSNIVIAVAAAMDRSVAERMEEFGEGDLVISSITYAEVALGSVGGKRPSLVGMQAFVEQVPVLPFDDRAAWAYASLPFRRGSFDRLIAAHALSHELTLVTYNDRDFRDLPGLRVENWGQ